jgi:hypothetical protein
VKVIVGDLDGVIKLILILLSIILVPLLWVLLRKDKSTDREGREPQVPDKRLSDETQPRSNLPLYGKGMDYTSQAIGKEWEHPDVTQYREKLRKDAEENKE